MKTIKQKKPVLLAIMLVMIMALSCGGGAPTTQLSDPGNNDDNNNGGQASTDDCAMEFRDLDSDNFSIVPPQRIRETVDGHYLITAAETQEIAGKSGFTKSVNATGYVYRVAYDSKSYERLAFPGVIPQDFQVLNDGGFFVCGSQIGSGTVNGYAMMCQADGTVVHEVTRHDLSSLSLSVSTPDGYLVAGIADDLLLKLAFLKPEMTIDWESELGTNIDPDAPAGSTIAITKVTDLILNPDGSFTVFVKLLRHDSNQDTHGMGLVKLSSSGSLQWSRCWWDPDSRNEPWYSPESVIGLDDGGFIISFWNNDAGRHYMYVNRLDNEGDINWSWENMSEESTPAGLAVRSDGVILNLIADYSQGERFCSISFIGSDGNFIDNKTFGVTSTLPAPDFPTDLIVTTDGHIVVTGYHNYYDDNNKYKKGIFIIKLDTNGNCSDSN